MYPDDFDAPIEKIREDETLAPTLRFALFEIMKSQQGVCRNQAEAALERSEILKGTRETVVSVEEIKKDLKALKEGEVAALRKELDETKKQVEDIIKGQLAAQARAEGRNQILSFLRDNATWLIPVAIAVSGYISYESGKAAAPEKPVIVAPTK